MPEVKNSIRVEPEGIDFYIWDTRQGTGDRLTVEMKDGDFFARGELCR